MVKIRTDYAETPWIIPGKVYEAEVSKIRPTLYTFIGELGSPGTNRA